MATIVKKIPGESDESLIAKFRRKVLADNVLIDLKEKEHYRSPSEKRKERLKALKRRK